MGRKGNRIRLKSLTPEDSSSQIKSTFPPLVPLTCLPGVNLSPTVYRTTPSDHVEGNCGWRALLKLRNLLYLPWYNWCVAWDFQPHVWALFMDSRLRLRAASNPFKTNLPLNQVPLRRLPIFNTVCVCV